MKKLVVLTGVFILVNSYIIWKTDQILFGDIIYTLPYLNRVAQGVIQSIIGIEGYLFTRYIRKKLRF